MTWTGLLQLWKLQMKTTNAAHICHPANMDSDLTGIFSTQHRLSKQAHDWIFKLTQENYKIDQNHISKKDNQQDPLHLQQI